MAKSRFHFLQGFARKAFATFMALVLAGSLFPAPSLALDPAGPMAVGAASSSGDGTLTVTKSGSPITSRNANDAFPMTIELENPHGHDLDAVAVAVADEDFLAEDPESPWTGAGDGPSVAAIARDVSEAAAAAARAAALAPPAAARAEPDPSLVALIDTGAPESGNVVARYSVVGDDAGDDNGHGTEMLAAIAREDPAARVVSIKALDASGRGNAAGVRAAIGLALDLGAGIVNLSLSAHDTAANAPIASGVADAAGAGAAVVAAAGNGGYDARYFTPANAAGALTVGAATDGEVRPGSNRGPCVDMYVEAGSTSEAAARVSGWLSANRGGDWREAALGSPLAVDVGDGALLFGPGGGAPVLAQVVDAVLAATEQCVTTGYFTVKLGSIGACRINVTGVGAGESKNYYKKAQTITWSLTNTQGTYFSAAGSTARTTDQLLPTGGTALYYRYVTLPVNVFVPAGYHGLDEAREDSGGQACSTYNNTSADHSEQSWRRADSNGGGMQLAYDSVRTIYLTINLAVTGMMFTTDKPAFHAVYRLNMAGNGYAVAYDANGGSGAPAATGHVYGTASPLSWGAPARAHHSFAGWNTAANGTGTWYSPGQSVTGLAAAGTATLYAQWSEDSKSTVTYDGNGGTPGRASDTVYTGESVTLPGATRPGYAFKGWAASSTAASGSTGSYAVSSTTTLYATWQEDDRVVRYNGNGGTPSRTSDTVSPGSSVSLPSVSAYPSGDMQDTGSYCTVTLSGNGGTVDGRATSSVRAAQYRDYGFSGWYTAASGGTRVGGSGSSYTPPAGATDLYMRWSTSYRYRAVTLPAPAREGYDFLGWATSPTAGSGTAGSYTPGGDVTLHAIWAEHTVRTITVSPRAGQAVTLSGIPADTAYRVTDGEQPRGWSLASASPQEGVIAAGGSAEVASASRYTAQLDFSVPAAIGFVARVDGTLIGPSDGAVRIESDTDAPIAVTGVQVRAADGFDVVDEPDGPGQVAFTLAPEGGDALSAADCAGGGPLAVDWPIATCGSLGIGGLSGKVACWDHSRGVQHEVASIIWKLAMRT